MKRIIILLVLVCSGTFACFANDFNDMKYKQMKELYDYKEYVPAATDRYSPGWSGVASFFIPGLAQIVCGEVGRGFAWWGGSIACSSVAIISGLLTAYSSYGDLLFFASSAGVVAINVCSIVDGVRVAKVKNMYNQDRMKNYSLDVDLYPAVACIKIAAGVQPTAGLTLALKF